MRRRPIAKAAFPVRTAPSIAAITASGLAPSPRASAHAVVAFSRSFSFLDPGLLDGLENPLAAALRVVAEARQRHHPLVEIDEVHRLRILVWMGFRQRNRNVLRISPSHVGIYFFPPPPSRS